MSCRLIAELLAISDDCDLGVTFGFLTSFLMNYEHNTSVAYFGSFLQISIIYLDTYEYK